MKSDLNNTRARVFERARELVEKDKSIPVEEKGNLLRLIQVLTESLEAEPNGQEKEKSSLITKEILSKQGLMTLVRQQADELDSLKKLSLNLTSSLDLQTVLDAVVSEAMRLIRNARAVHIFLYLHNRLEFGASLTSEGVRNKSITVPRKNGLTNLIATRGKLFVVEDMRTDELYKNSPPDWTGSIIGIPLMVNREVVGVMNLSRSTKGGFSSAELRLLELLADQAAVAISNASLHQQVTHQANSDSLTGLPNRRALDMRLEEEVKYAKRSNTRFAAIMMDLDGFKEVNDTYGHAIGDEFLRSAFNFLAGSMRATDFLARYGGDELTLILRQTDYPMAKVVCDKILENIKNFSYVAPDKQILKLGVSGGIAIYPNHADTGSDLLRAADSALYHAKKYLRGSFVIARGKTGPLTDQSSFKNIG
jgi:diguanylate cyclase (GGDEF)-like protein